MSNQHQAHLPTSLSALTKVSNNNNISRFLERGKLRFNPDDFTCLDIATRYHPLPPEDASGYKEKQVRTSLMLYTNHQFFNAYNKKLF